MSRSRLWRPVWVLAILAGWGTWPWPGNLASAETGRVLYETHFEPGEGFDANVTLIGQDGWVGEGTGGNGLVTNFFEGEGQHAFVGFNAPTNTDEFLNVWKPVNYRPGMTNPPVVTFSVLLSVEDSSETTTNRDDFRWSVYNSEGDRLFTIDFDNPALQINYLLDSGDFIFTGQTFTNSVAYQLALRMDFEHNLWSATLNGAPLATNLPVTTMSRPLNFGDVDAVWAIRIPGRAGDNFMVFDNYRVSTEAAEPSRLEALGMLKDGQFLVRCFGVMGMTYVVESSADLATWSSIATNSVPSSGHFDHLDEDGGSHRFYRMVAP